MGHFYNPYGKYQRPWGTTRFKTAFPNAHVDYIFSKSVKMMELIHHNLIVFYPSYLINLLKPTGHVMHQQFNIQQLYVLPTLYLCVSYLSENKQRLLPLTA